MEPIVAVFGPIVVEELVRRVRSFLGEQHNLHSDVKDKLESLGGFLRKLKCVIGATEGKQFQDPVMVEWLKEFKNLAYQVDDLLDTFAYRELEHNFSSKLKRGLRKIRNLLPLNHEELSDLSSLVTKLEQLTSEMKDFVEITKLDGKLKKRSFSCELSTGIPKKKNHSFVGREDEKERIIKFMLNRESTGSRKIPILPILGAGGIGKTALARVVYNDEKVKNHFSLKMWVSVSHNFDAVKLTREMLDQLDCRISAENLNELQVFLKQKLGSKKFLLVLDNIWSESVREVCDMIEKLCHQNEGSRILLTSRQGEAAKWMEIWNPIKLEGLPEKEFCFFFSQCAFGNANLEKNSELAAIGYDIALKLNGSPLAAEIVSELLTDNLNCGHLKIILNTICELEQDQHDIMPALRLSYMHLPLHLKQCFSYLSVTPKDWELFYNKVKGIWMALGMVNHDTKKRKEDVVQDYFNKLISMSYFHSTMKENVYILHDVPHDLAESIYEDYCFRIEDNNLMNIPVTVRHLSVSTKSIVSLKKNTLVLNNLRSLLFLHNYEVNFDDADLHYVFEQLKSIRVLSLSYCRIEKLPDDLSHLIHLRYLDLSHTGIRNLPDGVTKLYHLQILNLSQLEFDGVPERMNELINLRSLICSERTLSMVQGIGKMIQLQELMCPLSVQNVLNFDIGQLGDLKELGGCLHIKNLQNVDKGEQAKMAKLYEKENLVELVLCWESVEGKIKPEVEKEILEGLKPHQKLKRLRIYGYRGTRSPNWMVDNYGLNNLVSLRLIDCKAWIDLPSLGELPCLEFLELKGMHAIKSVEPQFYGSRSVIGFPSLRELIFDSLTEWEVWAAVDDKVNLFPHLQILRIIECPKLTKITPLHLTLQKLEIFNVGLDEFPKFLAKNPSALPSSSLSSSLAILSIKECQQLQYPSKWLLDSEDCLINLQELTIVPCNKLDAGLVKNSNKFAHLKKLCLEYYSSMEEGSGPQLESSESLENL